MIITDIILLIQTKLKGAHKDIYDLRHEGYDLYQFLNNIFLAKKKDNKADRETILIELIGIKMAAIIGDNTALVAKYIPIILYKIERIKIRMIINFPFLA